MKVKLTIGERIRTGGLLPAESDFSTLKIIRDLKLDLSFSEAEIKKNNIRTRTVEGNQFTEWANADKTTEINFGEIAHKIVVDVLKAKSEEKKLALQDITLYEKFVDR